MNLPAIAGVILSGGASRRMGTPKALLKIDGETFVDRLARLLAGACDPIVVVLGHETGRIQSGMERAGAVRFAVNPDPERGMLSSLQCGLAALPQETGRALFTPVDYPNIQASTIAALARIDAPVALPVFAGRRGHPVCVSRAVIEELLALPADAQARDVIRAHRGATAFVEVNDPGILLDVDDPEAYRALLEAR